jgi:hypothetical protein
MFLGFNHSPSFEGKCLYFVGGKQLWVIYQILYVNNVILALADLNAGAGGATAHAVDLLEDYAWCGKSLGVCN